MFPKEIQLIFDARTALTAAQQGDPRFDTLVEALMERCSLAREQVINNIAQLANGHISV